MTTATTSTVLDQTTDAAFRTWVQEVITQLVSTCGITQTSDTGQINTSTVTRAAANTAAGFVILRFNDTLQATAPIFIKLEFGSATANTIAQMWLTVGTGSNGSGTLTGVNTTRVAVTAGTAVSSTITSFTSRFVYNSTFGVCWMAWKQNSNTTAGANGFNGGFYIARSHDATGAATGTDCMVLSNSATATATTTPGFAQCLNFAGAIATPATPNNGWLAAGAANGVPYTQTTTTQAGNSYSVPCYWLSGNAPNISAYICAVLNSETTVGSTFTDTLVGSTPLTFLNCGGMFGSGISLGAATSAIVGAAPLWQ